MYAMMLCKAKSENLAHILGYQIWAVTEMWYIKGTMSLSMSLKPLSL